MKILFIVDYRSPIAINWIGYFVKKGHDVHVISTHPVEVNELKVKSLFVVPVAFSRIFRNEKKKNLTKNSVNLLLKDSRIGPAILFIQAWGGSLDVYRHTLKVREIVNKIGPDLVHAMRIPFEGILAAESLRKIKVPLLISVWGNDFTLFAKRYKPLLWLTRRAMHRADALHPDCKRDLELGIKEGFDIQKPYSVLPGAGGVQANIFYQGPPDPAALRRWGLNREVPIVLNPRGHRRYIRNDTYFKSIPLVLDKRPNAIFLSISMQGNAEAERWIRSLSIQKSVRLLPSVPRSEMAEIYRASDIFVSPSEHDGTPNTLLEGMSCGTFPVVGDIPSIREWVEDRINGLLCDPASPESIAKAILEAIDSNELRNRAAIFNHDLIMRKADYGRVMVDAERFYETILTRTNL
jgi:glycosyltransferase involved in cell wall biosynthesis